MKLFFAPYSPYVRLVYVVMLELGLAETLDLVQADTWDLPPELKALNSLQKVPTLITDGGSALYDSRVIVEYLCAEFGDATLLPPTGAARWLALSHQALGIGLMDLQIERFLERWRPANKQMPEWSDRLQQKAVVVLDTLNVIAGEGRLGNDIGSLAIGCALGYADFRFADEDWRTGRTTLANWYGVMRQRPSFSATEPMDWEDYYATLRTAPTAR